MTNPYYNPSGTPGANSPGASQPVRLEFAAIATAFSLFPALTGNANKVVVVNAGGTALTVTTGTLALAGNFATTGVFNTTLTQVATTTLILPAVDGTLATLDGTETLSNKTLTSPAVTGSLNLSGTTTPLLLNGSPGTAGQFPQSNGAGATPTWVSSTGSGKFLNSVTDTTQGYATDKLVVTSFLTLTTLSGGGNEQLQIGFDEGQSALYAGVYSL